jgi:hypothetical protein
VINTASVSIAKLAGVGLAVAALSACGSSHRVGLHDYSVPQVERVFAAQLIPLRQARHGPETGVVKLLDRNVEVDVVLNGADAFSCKPCVFRRVEGLSWTALGNVVVFYPHNQMSAVKAAVRSLQA